MTDDSSKARTLANGIEVWCGFDKLVPVGELRPHPRNPNTHPQRQIELLAKNIRYFGWVALIGDRRPVYPHKGRDGRTVQRFYSPRRKVVLSHRQSCHVHYWSNLNIKDTLARLRRNQDPGKGPTWEVPDDIDDDYLAQMESEQRVKEKGQWMWKQIGSRPNHYFDCESMQAAAATMLKIVGREAVTNASTDPNEVEG